MDHAFHLAVRRHVVPGLGVVRTPQLDNLTLVVFDDLLHFDDIAVPQLYLRADAPEPEEVRGGVLPEVVVLDKDLAGELEPPGAQGGAGGVVQRLDLLDPALRVVVDDDPERAQDDHPPQRRRVQRLPNAVVQHLDLGGRDLVGHPELLDEGPQGLGRDASAPHAAERGHPGVVPTVDDLALHQLPQLPLRRQECRHIESRHFELLRRALEANVIDEPIVQLPVRLELQRADGVRDALDRVLLTVCEVVQWVNAPLVPRVVVVLVQDPVNGHVAHVHVLVPHVALHAQHVLALLVLARPHVLKQLHVLSNGAVAESAFNTFFGH
mmetsp:Transcript_60752/g.185513  ORF Transcript_60752/g.185513 Transcript_60752/m.185513 type:complete len:324 (+) Transcript_60752:659-1630(+)